MLDDEGGELLLGHTPLEHGNAASPRLLLTPLIAGYRCVDGQLLRRPYRPAINSTMRFEILRCAPRRLDPVSSAVVT
jgi:hypothetical protein